MLKKQPATPIVEVSINGQYFTNFKDIYVEELRIEEDLALKTRGSITIIDKTFKAIDSQIIFPMFANPAKGIDMFITFGWGYYDGQVEWVQNGWRRVIPFTFRPEISHIYRVEIEFEGFINREHFVGELRNISGKPHNIVKQLAKEAGYEVIFDPPPDENAPVIQHALCGRSKIQEIRSLVESGKVVHSGGKFYVMSVDDVQKKIYLRGSSVLTRTPKKTYVVRGGKDVKDFRVQTDFSVLVFGAGGVKETRIDLNNKRSYTLSHGGNLPGDVPQANNQANRFVRSYTQDARASIAYEGYKYHIVEAEMTVIGDLTISPGDVVEVIIPTATGEPHWLSGKYLVMSVIHMITAGAFETLMSLRLDISEFSRITRG
ncbi:hypothetical protein [Hydrogenobacter thermophilus]|jgi:hypothetical protein|uniref:hypothetical protein n=1 Tax=Hydrogenobacter thermophilus TaxID=940 RepID=UPI0030FA98ED